MQDSINGGASNANNLRQDIVAILQANLGLPIDAISSHPDTRVLGAIPELDSMSVVSVLVTLEEQYGITIDDDEVDADVFATIGSLSTFLASKLG